MILLQTIVDALNSRKNRVLLVAEASMPERQFKAFRKLFLCEFGRDGLERELVRIIEQDKERNR